MHCGVGTPTDPGVPPRVANTGAFEVAKVTEALAGRYKVERILGEGGMATVYLATDQKHKRKVAVKVMRPELAATLGAERFLREVEIAGQLSHPHILPMYDSGEADGILYYVMPYIEGETLRERLQRDGALPVEEASLLREVSEALAYAHRQGIVHRDIKPANVLLSEGHALVADFGIARAVGDSGGEHLRAPGWRWDAAVHGAGTGHRGKGSGRPGRCVCHGFGAVRDDRRGAALHGADSADHPDPEPHGEAATAQFGARGAGAGGRGAGDEGAGEEPRRPVRDGRCAGTALDGARQHMTSASSSAITPPAATEVVPRTGKSPAMSVDGPKKWLSLRNGVIAAVAVLAVWAIGATVMAGRAGRTATAAAAASGSNRIAVLPFENQGATTDEYFADGIADEVRGKLSRVRGLEIIASSSTSEYKGSAKNLTDIANELHADYLLVGKVRWAGTEVSAACRSYRN